MVMNSQYTPEIESFCPFTNKLDHVTQKLALSRDRIAIKYVSSRRTIHPLGLPSRLPHQASDGIHPGNHAANQWKRINLASAMGCGTIRGASLNVVTW